MRSPSILLVPLLILAAAPAVADAQILTRLLRWQPDLPKVSADWRPGLEGAGGMVRVHEGPASKGSILLSIPVRHAATGVIVDNPRMPPRVRKNFGKHVGKPVYAISMSGSPDPIWCRWEPNPRKPFLASTGIDPVPTGECYPVLYEAASPVNVFGPQGLFVTELSWYKELTATHPGLRIELKPQLIGPPMRLEFAINDVSIKGVKVTPAVRWTGGEAALPPIEVTFDSNGLARVPALDAEFTLSRTAGSNLVEVAISKRPRSTYEDLHVL